MFFSKNKAAVKEQFREAYGKPKSSSFNFPEIERYYRNQASNAGLYIASDRTWHDLDMDEVFMYLDRTSSKVGQQFLYYLMRTIPANAQRSEHLEQLVQLFADKQELREEVQYLVSGLNKPGASRITSLLQESTLKAPAWFWLVKLLPVLSVLLLLLLPLYPVAFLPLMAVVMVSMGIHYWNKNNLFQHTSAITQLMRLHQVTKKLYPLLPVELLPQEVAFASKQLDALSHKLSFFKLEASLQSEAGALVELLVELVKAFFLLEPLLLFHVIGALNERREQIHCLFKFAGETDAAISVASLRQGLSCCCLPTIVAGQQKILRASEAYHPLLPKAVVNSIEVAAKSVLLTGSNMSGKTTFIRTIGINALLAQTINTCFAREFTLPRLLISAAIRISDNLQSEKSYYFEEVLTIKQMIAESGAALQHLFLLDELFKGTNTVERIAAGKAVLSYLNRGNDLVFVSTHDIELTGHLHHTYDLYHFSEEIVDEQIVFDYTLKAGGVKTRNAIQILALNGFPAEVIQEANEISKDMSLTAASSSSFTYKSKLPD